MSMGNGYRGIVFSGDPSRTAPAAQSRVQQHVQHCIARAQFAHAGEPKREGQSSGYMGHGHLGSQVQGHRCAATFVSTQCLVGLRGCGLGVTLLNPSTQMLGDELISQRCAQQQQQQLLLRWGLRPRFAS